MYVHVIAFYLLYTNATNLRHLRYWWNESDFSSYNPLTKFNFHLPDSHSEDSTYLTFVWVTNYKFLEGTQARARNVPRVSVKFMNVHLMPWARGIIDFVRCNVDQTHKYYTRRTCKQHWNMNPPPEDQDIKWNVIWDSQTLIVSPQVPFWKGKKTLLNQLTPTTPNIHHCSEHQISLCFSICNSSFSLTWIFIFVFCRTICVMLVWAYYTYYLCWK